MKSFSWVSFSVFIILAAIAGIFASNYNFFPTNDEGTLRSYLIKATEDPSFVAGMSKTFQKIYKEKGIYPTEDQIRLTNECLKDEIFTQLINSKETSIKTHLDKKYEIKSTSDFRILFNSEIMGKYGDTLKGIVRSCQAKNIEEEIREKNNSVIKKIELQNQKEEVELPIGSVIYSHTKGLICSLIDEKETILTSSEETLFNRDFYLIDTTFKEYRPVRGASLPDKTWIFYLLLNESVNELSWYRKFNNKTARYPSENHIAHSKQYVLDRKNLLITEYYCDWTDWFDGCMNKALLQKKQCKLVSGDELKKDWEITLKKAKESNRI